MLLEGNFDIFLSLFKFTSNREDLENLSIDISLVQWILRGEDKHNHRSQP